MSGAHIYCAAMMLVDYFYGTIGKIKDVPRLRVILKRQLDVSLESDRVLCRCCSQ